MAVMCYDLLPLTHPEFFPAQELPGFRAYWDATLRAGVRILCNSASIAKDLQSHAARLGLPDPQPMIVPLAASARRDMPGAPLRTPLQPGRFALFVSTLEPRKGHAVLLQAWRRLLRQGIPQRHDFRLLFVGRGGWMVDDVLDQLAAAKTEPYGALHWAGVDDDELERLYRDCAFCLYPSRYEGFGLPIIEAFTRGKAVIASNGGAVRETVGDLSPCLDPLDVEAWTDEMGKWIEHPALREAWELRIRRDFQPRQWPDVAEQIMMAAAA
jgi:glycosyltransferase involved in cell wall biosynthesis